MKKPKTVWFRLGTTVFYAEGTDEAASLYEIAETQDIFLGKVSWQLISEMSGIGKGDE